MIANAEGGQGAVIAGAHLRCLLGRDYERYDDREEDEMYDDDRDENGW